MFISKGRRLDHPVISRELAVAAATDRKAESRSDDAQTANGNAKPFLTHACFSIRYAIKLGHARAPPSQESQASQFIPSTSRKRRLGAASVRDHRATSRRHRNGDEHPGTAHVRDAGANRSHRVQSAVLADQSLHGGAMAVLESRFAFACTARAVSPNPPPGR